MNLIDTPGHVDFTHEVSRSLAACEGALLVVDANQGEAQTLANVYMAPDNDFEIIPVLNKIDLFNAEPQRVIAEIEEVIGLDAQDAASQRKNIGIQELLEQIVQKVPPPTGKPDVPLRGLIFDSWFDPYLGIVILVRVVDGKIKVGEVIRFMATGYEYEVTQLGVFTPFRKERSELSTGEVGFVCASIKTIGNTKIGDTVTHADRPATTHYQAMPRLSRWSSVVFIQ